MNLLTLLKQDQLKPKRQTEQANRQNKIIWATIHIYGKTTAQFQYTYKDTPREEEFYFSFEYTDLMLSSTCLLATIR